MACLLDYRRLSPGVMFGLCLWLLTVIGQAQLPGTTEKPGFWSDFRMNGYLKYLNGASFQHVDSTWQLDGLVHHRLNLAYDPSPQWSFQLGWRNRLIFGAGVTAFPHYDRLLDEDAGAMDLSWVPASGRSYVIHSILDRLSAEYIQGKWQLRVGRQRVNWGRCFVWNPNDWFNAYSFFDFDYEERPGTDGARVQYYYGTTSSIEAAVGFLDGGKDFTAALNWTFSVKSYDIQLMAGQVLGDWAVGAGWSGILAQAGFRGEVSWFVPRDAVGDQAGQVVMAVSGDYAFRKPITVQVEAIYNSNGSGRPVPLRDLNTRLTPQRLILGYVNVMGNVSGNITPLIQLGGTGILNPGDGSWFLGPSLTLSLHDNTEVYLLGQLFQGAEGTEYGGYGNVLFFRLKWSY